MMDDWDSIFHDENLAIVSCVVAVVTKWTTTRSTRLVKKNSGKKIHYDEFVTSEANLQCILPTATTVVIDEKLDGNYDCRLKWLPRARNVNG